MSKHSHPNPEWFGSALIAAVEAGKAILEVYNSPDFEVEQKADDSPLTRADRDADKVIGAYLCATGIPVLSEESAPEDFSKRREWALCWIVDPLDGTKEFIKRNGEFTVNIALVANGVPVFGVVYAPALGVLYYGEKGKGAWKVTVPDPFAHNIDLQPQQRLPQQKLPEKFTMVGSRSHASPETDAYVEEMRKTHGSVDFITSGSSLKFCLVAEGKAHAYPRFAPTMEWDTAAGQAVLEAAGGAVVEYPSMQPLRYNRENLRNGWFLATAPGSRH